MRAVLWIIAIFALAAGLSLVAEHSTGTVLVSFSHYRIQLSLNLVICLLVLGFLAGYVVVRLVLRTMRVPKAIGRYRDQRRRVIAERKLHESLRAFMEGRYAQALKLAGDAYRRSDKAGIETLVAARAAHELQDHESYRDWIGRASQIEWLRTARLMTEAELALDGRRFDEASNRLVVLRERGERHIAAQRLALKAAEGAGKWDETARLARQLRKHKGLTDDAAAAIVRESHLECLRQRTGDGAALAEYWASISAREASDHVLLERSVPLLVAAGQGSIARRAVEDMLSVHWEPALARSYADCCVDAEDLSPGLAKAEAWLVDHPSDAGLLLTLGRLCMRMKLWGKAQSYLEASMSVAADSDTSLALARLAEQLDRPAEAQRYYRQAAEIATA
ncbi:MAG: heme biosynthesis protein HemY [Rhodocyclaceae bacterium]|nr:heme biosynthesis protein HemY [Rhodocyclaceae bacterium]